MPLFGMPVFCMLAVQALSGTVQKSENYLVLTICDEYKFLFCMVFFLFLKRIFLFFATGTVNFLNFASGVCCLEWHQSELNRI